MRNLKTKFRSLPLVLLPGMLMLFPLFAMSSVSSDAPSADGNYIYKTRTHEVVGKMIPAGVLKVVKAYNIDSPSFPEGLALEVKNTSRKPIYFLSAVVLMPESKQFFDGRPLSLRLTYGDPRLMKNSNLASASDSSVKAGETCLLRLNPLQAKATKEAFNRKMIPTASANRLVTYFQVINFGDGTGYIGDGAYPSTESAKTHSLGRGVSDSRFASSFSTTENRMTISVLSPRSPCCCGWWELQYQDACYFDGACIVPIAVTGNSHRNRCWTESYCPDPITGEPRPCPSNLLMSCGYDCPYY